MKERLQKLIAAAGVCSRRKAEGYIAAGKVTVNGVTAHIGDSADSANDVIKVFGKAIHFTDKCTYLMLHKPRGYVTTMHDEQGRATAAELVADCGVRVYPVGRLDRDSEGLLLFTNDGALTQSLLHPKHQVDKTYEVTVAGEVTDAASRLSSVREIDGEPIAPAQVRLLRQKGGQALLQVVLHQGKNRQIRRMCAQVGLTVKRLKRVQEHTLRLGDLPCGEWRYLTEDEIRALKGGECSD